MYIWMFIYILDYNLILIYFIVQIAEALGLENPFIRYLCPVDIFPKMFVVCLSVCCTSIFYYKMLQAHLVFLLFVS